MSEINNTKIVLEENNNGNNINNKNKSNTENVSKVNDDNITTFTISTKHIDALNTLFYLLEDYIPEENQKVIFGGNNSETT